MGAGGSLSVLSGRRRRPVRFAIAVLRRQLAGVDEVLELLLVLIRVAVGLVAKDTPLLDEIFECRLRIARRAEAKLAGRLRRRKGAAPAQQIYELNKTPSPANNPVKQLSTNYFVVMVNSEIDAGILEFLLRNEFEKRGIVADFEYGIYDCSSERMVYGD